jgi:acetyltransferase-like isoleucine patch superfamily enzyme
VKYPLFLLRKFSRDWAVIQNRLADIPGEKGVRLRSEAYKPFFLRFGDGVRIEEGCRIYHPERIVLEDDVRINVGGLIYGSGGVHIGRHVRIGPRCFLHSANHDISFDEKTYFEKGYNYESVFIDDNCLLSANVSILPGVKMGVGCFVACGAVVLKGTYDDNVILKGLPAKIAYFTKKSDRFQQSPSIALIVPKAGRYEEAAKLLVTVLRLPQVEVFKEGDGLPESVHSIISFGPAEWRATGYSTHDDWHFAKSNSSIDGIVSVKFPFLNKNNNYYNVIQPIIYYAITSSDDSKPITSNTAIVTTYYCLKRINKSAGNISFSSMMERLLFAFAILNNFDDDFPSSKYISTFMPYILGKYSKSYEIDINKYLVYVESLLTESLCKKYQFNESKVHDLLNLNYKSFTENPIKWCLLVFYFRGSINNNEFRNEFCLILANLINDSDVSLILSYIGIICFLIDDSEMFGRVCDKLFDKFLDEKSKCMRTTIDSKSYCYNPILSAVLLINAKNSDENFQIEIKQNFDETMKWQVFPGKNSNWSIENNECCESLIDIENKIISVSVIENWLKIMSAPELSPGLQFELNKVNYNLNVYVLENFWLSFFAHLQHSAKKPLILVNPWPYNYRAAVSIRYDVDRKVSTESMLKIVAIQKSYINSNCGSWYLIPKNDLNERVRNFTKLFLQENGLHATTISDLNDHVGITFHSGPGAMYWRGRATIIELENANVKYGEMFASQLIMPKPIWIEGGEYSHKSFIWFLPIHFPLEGTTKDVTLEYFDKLIDEFRELIGIGGYAIIASHPDLNQKLLIELLQREKLKNIWFASISQVVDRCQKLLDYGSLSIVLDSEGIPCLKSKNSISDVHVQVYQPEETQPHEYCLQLNAGMPRRIN